MLATDWGSEEWQAALVRMMELYGERERLESTVGDPSFSLGLKQELKTNNEDDTHLFVRFILFFKKTALFFNFIFIIMFLIVCLLL